MSNFVHKLKSLVAGEPFEDEEYGLEEDVMEYSRAAEPHRADGDAATAQRPDRRNNLKVVGHPSSAQMAQVVVMEPRAFEESLDIIDYLKDRKAVILNLHMLDNAQSQRVVDFLSGATHAIEGNQQRIGDGVFIFTPSNVVISSDIGNAGLSLSDAYWNTPR